MLRPLAALLVCAAVFGVVASEAVAQPPHWKREHSRAFSRGHHWHRPYQSPAPWASFWGGLLGGYIVGQMQRQEEEREEIKEDLEPWSKAWFAYCTAKYKSFDPKTGRYLSYDGTYYFCK